MSLAQLQRIRWGVRLVLVLGVAASVTANVLHARPNPISQTIAAWPPLALLLTVELISRVPVHSRRLAFARLVATAAIAGIAAWVSYWHMSGVAAKYGETGASPYLLPLSVDGLIVVASICLVELAGRVRDASGPVTVEPAPASEPIDVDAITEPEVTPEPEPQPDQSDVSEPDPVTPPKRQRRALTNATKVQRAAARMPGATVAQVAAKAGVSESTARRYLTSPTGPVPAETTTNNHEFAPSA